MTDPEAELLASIAACMIKGAERVASMIQFDLRGMDVHVHGIRQDAAPRMIRIERDHRRHGRDRSAARTLHKNIRTYGTMSNTIAAAAELHGVIRRTALEI